jgi:D-alanyl-D-alanine carboxypeptidase
MTTLRLLPLALAVALAGCAVATDGAIPVPVQSAEAATATPTPAAEHRTDPPAFDRNQYSIDDAASLWVVANKTRRLSPKKYVPNDLVTLDVPHTYDPTLRADAAKAYKKMLRAAAKDGKSLVLQSAYRSYSTQVTVYDGWVAKLGQAGADRQSARPGYSEHQTGLSVDIAAGSRSCTIQECFAKTPEGKWLSKHAWEFGWVLRYPKGRTSITGYKYEPWHWRYVGTGLAEQVHLVGAKETLEEFWGLPAAPDYL